MSNIAESHLPAKSASHKPMLTCFRVALFALALIPTAALADRGGAGVQNEVTDLIRNGISWMQKIAALLMVAGFVNAGTKFFSDEHADHAWASLKKATTGAIVVGAAVGLAEWIKSAFSHQQF